MTRTKQAKDFLAELIGAIEGFSVEVEVGNKKKHSTVTIRRPSGRFIVIYVSHGSKPSPPRTVKNAIARAVRFARDGIDSKTGEGPRGDSFADNPSSSRESAA